LAAPPSAIQGCSSSARALGRAAGSRAIMRLTHSWRLGEWVGGLVGEWVGEWVGGWVGEWVRGWVGVGEGVSRQSTGRVLQLVGCALAGTPACDEGTRTDGSRAGQ
jgi:hypothetical protein